MFADEKVGYECGASVGIGVLCSALWDAHPVTISRAETAMTAGSAFFANNDFITLTVLPMNAR